MKKRFTAIALLVLMLAFLALLGGCSAEEAPGAKEPVSEPDTDSRTVTRTIGEHQTVVYRFHTERILGLHDAEISLALFDSDADAFDHAGNWCVSRIGVVPALGQSFNTFSVGKGPDTPEDTAWKKPFWDSPPRQVGFTEIGKVDGADMALTITRSGNNMKLLLDIDGARAWLGRQAIGNMADGPVYLYLAVGNRTLTNIQFEDLGSAGMALPRWQRLLIIVGALAVGFGLHLFARVKGADYYIMDFSSIPTTGLFLSFLGLAVVLLGRSHPDLLSKLSFGAITLRLQAGGPGFWIPAAVFGLGALGFTIFWICYARDYGCNPLAYLLAALPLGLCHTIWWGTVVFVVLLLLNQIFELIMAVVLIVVLCIVGVGMMEMDKKPHVEVTTVTRIYNSSGNLVDAKYDVDYVELPEDKNK